MESLVNWPAPVGEPWVDTHEGGLFAFLVIRKPSGHQDECMVDVEVMLTRPDAIVEGPRSLWPVEKNQDARWDVVDKLRQAKEEEGMKWAMTAFSGSSLSDSVLVSVYLGSTCHSLGGPMGIFSVRYEHLTEAGQAVYDALAKAYGVEPEILTCIDT